MAGVSVMSALNSPREAVEARYLDVDPVYAEPRDIRLLGFVMALGADCVLFSSFIFAYLYLRTASPAWPPFVGGHPLPRLDTAFAAVNSMVLFRSGGTL